jgi:PAS domain S-box-containing protein
MVSKRVILCVAAGVLGFVVNGFTVPVFNDVTLIFGGIFYLLIALVYGPIAGLATSLIASSRTFFLWGHPYGLITFGLEGLVVGWLVRRRMLPLFADLLYWTLLGAPLLVLMYIVYLEYPSPIGWAIVVKQPLNGLLDVIVAELLLGVPWLHRRLAPPERPVERRPLRATVFHGLVLMATLPLLLLGIMHGRTLAERLQTEAANRLQEATRAIGRNIDDYLIKHREAVISLAGSLQQTGNSQTEVLNQWLRRYHSIYDGFITMLVANKEARLMGAHPLVTVEGRPVLTLGETVGDREYFKQPMSTGQPYISDVFLGRGFGHDPIVAISAPVFDRDRQRVGIVEGSLNLARFKQFGADYQAMTGATIVILDQRNRVIYSSQTTAYDVLQDLTGSPLMTATRQASGRASFYVDERGDNTNQTTRSLVHRVVTKTTGWQVFIRQPLTQIQRETQQYYLVVLIWSLAGIAGSTLLARLIAGRVTRPLERLVDALREFSVQGTVYPPLSVAGTAPVEVDQLMRDFGDMAVRLDESYGKVRQALAEREAINQQLQGVLADLDQKVRAQTAQLRAVLDTVGEGIITVDSTGAIVIVNREIEIIWGYSQDELIGKNLQMLIPEKDRKAHVLGVERYVATGSPPLRGRRCELQGLRKDGSTFPLEMAIAETRIGERLLFTAAVRDVTQQRELQAQLMRAEQLRALGIMAGGVAHNFNNLLTAVLGHTQLLQLRATDPETAHDLTKIETATLMAAEMVRRVLDYTKTKGDRELELVDCNQVVIDAVELTRPQWEQASQAAGQPIEMKQELGADATVLGSARDLRQSVLNLIFNAIEAMPGGGRITLTTQRQGDQVVLQVQDTGVGMNNFTQQHAFDPFFSTKQTVGVGLGLTQVYGAIERHRGRIDLTSAPGQGTIVTVTLPYATRHPESPPAVLVSPEMKPARLLVVEDHRAVREVLTAMLTNMGHTVAAYEDGSTALEAFDRDAYDLACVDLVMPGISGQELVGMFKQRKPRMPVVVITGWRGLTQPDPRLERVDGYLEKPFGYQQLSSVLAIALEGAGSGDPT